MTFLLPLLKHIPDLDDYVSTQEATDVLILRVETVREFLRYGKLEGLKIGRTWLVPREAITDYQKHTAEKAKHDPTR